MTYRRMLLASATCATLALGACNSEDPKAAEVNKEAEEVLPNIKVELPPSPNFDEGKVDEKYADGAFSIYGLRTNIDDNVKGGDTGTEIMVRGWVQEIYVPPECPEGEMCPPGKQPHVWISDKPEEKGKKRMMMVVNYRFQIPDWDAKRWKGQPEVVLEVGKQYSFKGKFKRFSDTGFADDRGLLEFAAYKPIDPATNQEQDVWVFPPGAPWHPVEIARVEEENKDLAERASKTAESYKNRDK